MLNGRGDNAESRQRPTYPGERADGWASVSGMLPGTSAWRPGVDGDLVRSPLRYRLAIVLRRHALGRVRVVVDECLVESHTQVGRVNGVVVWESIVPGAWHRAALGIHWRARGGCSRRTLGSCAGVWRYRGPRAAARLAPSPQRSAAQPVEPSSAPAGAAARMWAPRAYHSGWTVRAAAWPRRAVIRCRLTSVDRPLQG